MFVHLLQRIQTAASLYWQVLAITVLWALHLSASRVMGFERFNPLKPSGHYMYRQFNIQQFYVLPTQCIYVFCVDLRTNSDYFPIQR